MRHSGDTLAPDGGLRGGAANPPYGTDLRNGSRT